MDWLQEKLRLPVYKFWIDPIEKIGLASFPVTVIVLLAIVGIIAIGAGTTFAPQVGSLQLTVKAGGAPVANALATLSIGQKELSEYTDESGLAVFEKIKYGEQATLTIEKQDYPAYTKTITLSPSKLVNLDSGSENGFEATITVTDNYNVPINASVRFNWQELRGGKENEEEIEANDLGEASLELNAASNITASASAPGFSQESINFPATSNTRKSIALKWLGGRDRESYMANARAAYGDAAGDQFKKAFDSLLSLGYDEPTLLSLTPSELIKKQKNALNSWQTSQLASQLASGEAQVVDENGSKIALCEKGTSTTTVDASGSATIQCEDGTTKKGKILANESQTKNSESGASKQNQKQAATVTSQIPACILFKSDNQQTRAYLKIGEANPELLTDDKYEVIKENVSAFNAELCIVPFDPPEPSAWLFKASSETTECANMPVFNYSQLTDADPSTNHVIFDASKSAACKQAIIPAPRKVGIQLSTTNRKNPANPYVFTILFSNLYPNNTLCSDNWQCACGECNATYDANKKRCCFAPLASGAQCEASTDCQKGMQCNNAKQGGTQYCCASGACCSTDSDCKTGQACSQNNNCTSCGGLNQAKCSSPNAECEQGLMPNPSTSKCADLIPPTSTITWPAPNSKISLNDFQNGNLVIYGTAIDSPDANSQEHGSKVAYANITIKVFNDTTKQFELLVKSAPVELKANDWNYALTPQKLPLQSLNENRTQIYVNATDNADNTENAKPIEVRIDNTPPKILYFTATSLPSNSTQAEISWSATEPTEYAFAYYGINETGGQSLAIRQLSFPQSKSQNLTLKNLNITWPDRIPMKYNLTLLARDSFGNKKTYSQTFIPTDPCQKAIPSHRCGYTDPANAPSGNPLCNDDGQIYQDIKTYTCNTGVCKNTATPQVTNTCEFYDPILFLLVGLALPQNACNPATNTCCIDENGGCGGPTPCCEGFSCKKLASYYYNSKSANSDRISQSNPYSTCADIRATKDNGASCAQDTECYPTLYCNATTSKCERCIGLYSIKLKNGFELPQNTPNIDYAAARRCCEGLFPVVISTTNGVNHYKCVTYSQLPNFSIAYHFPTSRTMGQRILITPTPTTNPGP